MPNPATIKRFDFSHTGAPTMIGAAGSLVALLDACLLNGYNSKSAQSIAVSAGVATVTYATAHGYVVDQVLAFSGAAEAVFNDEFRVATVPTTTTLTFAISGAPASASGTITSKVAPLGWEKQFVGTANQAVYRSLDLSSTRAVLKVDDTNPATINGASTTYMAQVWMGESATSFANLVGQQAIGGATLGGSYGWKKSTDASTAVRWTLVGNSKTFWLLPAWNVTSYPTHRAIYGFGDFASFKPGDLYNCFLQALNQGAPSYPGQGYGDELQLNVSYATTYNGLQLLRAAYGYFGNARAGRMTLGFGAGSISGYGAGLGDYPGPFGGSLPCFATYYTEPVGPRGVVPGMLSMGLNHNGYILDGDVLPGGTLFPGRKLLVIRCGQGTASPEYQTGRFLLDLTGPW